MKIISVDLINNIDEPEEEQTDSNVGGINTSINTGDNASSEVSNKSRKKKKSDEEEDFGPKFKVIIE